MSVLRRILGVLVMIAGILGLLLSLAGLALVWIAKPNVTAAANTTIATLTDSVGTSKDVMQTITEALGATVDSVDALSAMLATTAATVGEPTRAHRCQHHPVGNAPLHAGSSDRFTAHGAGCRRSSGKHHPIPRNLPLSAERCPAGG